MQTDDFYWQLQDHEAEQREYEERIARIQKGLEDLMRIEAEQDALLRKAITELKESLDKAFEKPKKGDLW